MHDDFDLGYRGVVIGGEWREIGPFKDYFVDPDGRVLNRITGRLVKPQKNGQYVNIRKRGGPFVMRSVAKLRNAAFPRLKPM